MYSLWQAGKLLGHFGERWPVLHHGRRVGARGILEPTDAFTDIESVMQTRVPIFPGEPVFHTDLDPEFIGDVPKVSKQARYPSEGALKQLTPEEARGVSTDRIFEIRDQTGELVETRTIVLERYFVAPHAIPTEWGPIEARPEYWLVSFSEASVP
jgi:hypothetical protein